MFIALGVTFLTALVVLAYAVYPGRGRTAPGPARGVGAALGRMVDAVAPEPVEVPPHGLLGNADTDAAMRERIAKVERGITVPFSKAGGLIKDVADHFMPVDGGPSTPQLPASTAQTPGSTVPPQRADRADPQR